MVSGRGLHGLERGRKTLGVFVCGDRASGRRWVLISVSVALVW